jgi:hypothetical protein
MKQFYHLKGWHWLFVVTWAVFEVLSRDDSTPVMLLRFVFAFAVGYCFIQCSLQRVVPLTLVVKTSGSKGGTKEDGALFETLHDLFKIHFPKDGQPEFDGFNSNREQICFYFKGADPDVIMKAIQPLLKDIPLPPGSHLLVLTGPDQTKELPVFATV